MHAALEGARGDLNKAADECVKLREARRAAAAELKGSQVSCQAIIPHLNPKGKPGQLPSYNPTSYTLHLNVRQSGCQFASPNPKPHNLLSFFSRDCQTLDPSQFKTLNHRPSTLNHQTQHFAGGRHQPDRAV